MSTAKLLPSTVIGSYSFPEWLERLKDEYLQRRRADHLEEIYRVAIKAALKDQEQAGIDLVSDGELRRDNDVDFLLSRIQGVTIRGSTKLHYSHYHQGRVDEPLPEPDGQSLGPADYRFAAEFTDHPIKVSLTGPFSLSRHIENQCVRDRARARAGSGPLGERRGARAG